jgi:HK97 family phage prohead protease
MQFVGSPFEIKELNDSGRIEGLLAGFGDADHDGDTLLPGCLTKSLATRTTPLPMLLFHDMARPIGAWKEWEERADGLHVKGSLTLSTRDAQEAHALAKDGALTGLSIGWRPVRGEVDQKTGKRVITEAKLFEGSLVTVPAHGRTRVTAIKSITNARDIAEILQEAGLSGRKAKAAAGAAWKSINENDDAASEDEIRAILNSSAARIAALGD